MKEKEAPKDAAKVEARETAPAVEKRKFPLHVGFNQFTAETGEELNLIGKPLFEELRFNPFVWKRRSKPVNEHLRPKLIELSGAWSDIENQWSEASLFGVEVNIIS